MAFKREKKVKGHSYHYLVENTRQDGRVRQDIVQYFGRAGESQVHKAYRENVGSVTPIIAEELAKAELQWPEDQILTAIREAVVNRKLSWAYIVTILQRYDRDGFTPPRRERREQLLKDPMAAAKAAGWIVIGDEDDEPEEGDDAALSGASRYPSGRPIKCGNFVIGGYTPTTSSRPFRSLVLGLPSKEGLKHVGNVGVGFKLNSLPVYDHLQSIRTEESPFEPGTDMKKIEKHGSGVSWVRPTLIAEVKYTEVTKAGKLFMPMFKRLRPDLNPDDARVGYDGESAQGQRTDLLSSCKEVPTPRKEQADIG